MRKSIYETVGGRANKKLVQVYMEVNTREEVSAALLKDKAAGYKMTWETVMKLGWPTYLEEHYNRWKK